MTLILEACLSWHAAWGTSLPPFSSLPLPCFSHWHLWGWPARRWRSVCGYWGASAVEMPSLELCLHPRQLEAKGKQGPCLPLSHRWVFPLGFAFFASAKFEISNLISPTVWPSRHSSGFFEAEFVFPLAENLAVPLHAFDDSIVPWKHALPRQMSGLQT